MKKAKEKYERFRSSRRICLWVGIGLFAAYWVSGKGSGTLNLQPDAIVNRTLVVMMGVIGELLIVAAIPLWIMELWARKRVRRLEASVKTETSSEGAAV